jgi:hypothetical protein
MEVRRMKNESQRKIISTINDVLATRITMLVGSIWAFYAFVIFGLIPILWPQNEQQVLYWSNFLQLIFLPVITVGTAVLNRDSQSRADEDHETIQKEFALLKDNHSKLDTSLQQINLALEELKVLAGQGDVDSQQAVVKGEENSPFTSSEVSELKKK